MWCLVLNIAINVKAITIKNKKNVHIPQWKTQKQTGASKTVWNIIKKLRKKSKTFTKKENVAKNNYPMYFVPSNFQACKTKDLLLK